MDRSADVTYGDHVVVRVGESELPVRVNKPPFVRDGLPAVELAAL